MARKKYVVKLTGQERKTLLELTRSGTLGARQQKRALILLKADEGMTDPQIMATSKVSRPTAERVRKRFAQGGLERALNDDPRPGRNPILDGRGAAQLVAIATSQAPAGHHHWSLRMLADTLVEQGVVDGISHETVRQTLRRALPQRR